MLWILLLLTVAIWLLVSPRIYPSLYDRFIFKPNEQHGDPEEFRRLIAQHSGEEFHFANRQGTRLHAWLIGSVERAPFLLFYSIGKDGDIARRSRTISLLLETGMPVFIYEYSGYGQSEGRPELTTLCNDAVDAFDFAVNLGFQPGQVVLYGESLGSAFSATMLPERKPAGFIIKSSFAGLVLLAKELFWPLRVYPRSLFPTLRLDTCEALRKADLPVFVIHGKGDRMARGHHAQMLHDATLRPSKLLWLPGSRHAFMPEADERLLVTGIREFVLSLMRSKC